MRDFFKVYYESQSPQIGANFRTQQTVPPLRALRLSQSPQIGANFRTNQIFCPRTPSTWSQSPQIGANFRTEGRNPDGSRSETRGLNPLKSGQTSGPCGFETVVERPVQSQSPQIGANFRTQQGQAVGVDIGIVSIPSNRGKLPDPCPIYHKTVVYVKSPYLGGSRTVTK